jgi:hypothetical protein
MITNRELALIPDSALELLEPRGTSSAPTPRPSTTRGTVTTRSADRRAPRRAARAPRPAEA